MNTLCESRKQTKLLFAAVWSAERIEQMDSIRGFLKEAAPALLYVLLLDTHTHTPCLTFSAIYNRAVPWKQSFLTSQSQQPEGNVATKHATLR